MTYGSPQETVTYTYDDHDRLYQKQTPQGTLTYTYDAAGNLASMTSSNANGVSVSYTYDSLNRLATVVDNRLPAGQQTTTYSYDPASNLATVTYPNGLQSQFTLDSLNRVTSLNNAKLIYDYELDATGNRKKVIEHLANDPNGRTVNWSYDNIYRLTDEVITLDPHSRNGNAHYDLDPVGNRTQETATLPGLLPGSFTYDADDRLNTETYDANGNTLTSGGKTFTYDFANRLKSMTEGAVTVTLAYDADGNRVAKTVNGVTTRYLVDDLNPTGYAQVVEEVTAGAVTRQYTYGLQRISQTQQIANARTPAFYGYDGAGTVRLLTDSTGTVTDTYDYDAWGNPVNTTGSTPNVYLYRGEQYDSDLSFYYLRARYLNPLMGKFLSKDPAEGVATDPNTLHRYLYASADPVNRTDPAGLADGPESPHAGLLMYDATADGGYLVFSPLKIHFVGDVNIPHRDFCHSPLALSLLPPPITSRDLDKVFMKCLGLEYPAGIGTGVTLWPVWKPRLGGASGSTEFTSLLSILLRGSCGTMSRRRWAPVLFHWLSTTKSRGGCIARWCSAASILLDAAAAACVIIGMNDLESSRWQPLEKCGCVGSGSSGSLPGGTAGTSGGAPPGLNAY
jgi:RHS repeat-associated protein